MDHHDIALVDAGGTQLARERINDDAAGFGQLTALLVEHGDCVMRRSPSRSKPPADSSSPACPPPAAWYTRSTRYRDRHSVARKKSDAVDAAAFANIPRTDMAVHRPLPSDSELVQAVAVLARAQQDAVWDRGQAHNQLRSQLREFYPAILEACADHQHGLCSREARAILAAAPTPTTAAGLTRRRLRRGSRKRRSEGRGRTGGAGPPFHAHGPWGGRERPSRRRAARRVDSRLRRAEQHVEHVVVRTEIHDQGRPPRPAQG
ncbi:transposase [Streptomyces sp. NPDC005811]|uniref:IS110 family transposase n=1 Tax=Streptomyces sp. NPDC005811 TaxID=3154565 RepID=UPI0033E4295F